MPGGQTFPQMGNEGQPVPPDGGTFPQMNPHGGGEGGTGFLQRGERPADFDGSMMPGAPSADGSEGTTVQRPNGMEQPADEVGNGGLLWVGISTVILLAGLLLAFRFKRR